MPEQRYKKAIELIQALGACYGDIRVYLNDQTEILSTLSGSLDAYSYDQRQGFGVRVLYDGAWGFASGEVLADLETVTRKAVENARTAAGLTHSQVLLLPKQALIAEYCSPVGQDPFAMALGDKTGFLLELDSRIKHPQLQYWGVGADFYKQEILYFDTEGARISKNLLQVNAMLYAFAADSEGKQQRRFHYLYYDPDGTVGWENLLAQDFEGQTGRITEELLSVCAAPLCSREVCDLIVLPKQLALQTHETIGHALELDRILGYELSYAGGSIVTLEDFGTLRYGSEKLTARADGTLKNSPGSCGFDDDGVPSRNVTLIEKGILQGAVCSRQMTAEANQRAGHNLFEYSGGASRASSYNRPPLERMNNINIDPGADGSLEDIIAGCENGLMVDSPASWSIGSNRENFHFACEIGWKIKNGKIAHVVRNPCYRGDTLRFWNSLAKVGDPSTCRLEVVFNCGKGQPNQIMRLGHCVPVCLFTDVQVGF